MFGLTFNCVIIAGVYFIFERINKLVYMKVNITVFSLVKERIAYGNNAIFY